MSSKKDELPLFPFSFLWLVTLFFPRTPENTLPVISIGAIVLVSGFVLGSFFSNKKAVLEIGTGIILGYVVDLAITTTFQTIPPLPTLISSRMLSVILGGISLIISVQQVLEKV